MKLLKIAFFCALAAIALPAQAATVTMDLTNTVPGFQDGFVNSGDTVRADGFSLTFRNIEANGFSYSKVDSDGTWFGLSAGGEITSVDLVFGVDTIVETYDIGFGLGTGADTAAFQISGANGTSGLNSLDPGGTYAFDMGTIPVFLAGETYTLTNNALFATIAAFELSSPQSPSVVPLPASLPLLLAGFGAIGLLRRRRT
ncbi:VPLPA-CTERM sorting domain-containing protein [Roseobacter sp. MH60115]|uniref:VPLPA-CTERM sorting domain-containing protein n=1 Tax=Roseobacter sp. MH60115 TaxID=2785324 RepID=UPI0018A3398B|nr:VPLPA-CTERM sorting domain-containing protein [Roseobacter sp. MH60115]